MLLWLCVLNTFAAPVQPVDPQAATLVKAPNSKPGNKIGVLKAELDKHIALGEKDAKELTVVLQKLNSIQSKVDGLLKSEQQSNILK